ncbi:O-antigen ligase family protein [Guyparkeria sp. TX1]|uniref:O-antigen ligase family protein n=1 Tax=Guyparkeria sp. TX1 TaxID=3115001 RepID=UPI003977C73C
MTLAEVRGARWLRQFLAKVPFWYIVAVPSLLFLTNIGEKAYQDAFFIVLLGYAVVKGGADWSRPVLVIWVAWLAYLFWSTLTDSLGEGALVLDPLRTGLLMLLLPWLVGWARADNFSVPLRMGFRLALIVATAVALIQVLMLGHGRAAGSENALVFATLVAMYGLFVVHEGCVRGRGWPLLWMFLALIPVALSGSRAVLMALLMIFLVMLFYYRHAVNWRVLMLGGIGAVLFLSLVAGPQLSSRVTQAFESAPSSKEEWRTFRDEFLGMGFVNEETTSNGPQAENATVLKDRYATSMGFRVVYWRTGWEVFLAHPVTGVGSTQEMLKIGGVLGMGAYFDDRHGHVHNMFLQHLVTGGVPKMLLLLAVLALPLVLLGAGAGREIILFMTAALMLFGMTNIVLELTVVTFIYTLVLAHLLASRPDARSRGASSA